MNFKQFANNILISVVCGTFFLVQFIRSPAGFGVGYSTDGVVPFATFRQPMFCLAPCQGARDVLAPVRDEEARFSDRHGATWWFIPSGFRRAAFPQVAAGEKAGSYWPCGGRKNMTVPTDVFEALPSAALLTKG